METTDRPTLSFWRDGYLPTKQHNAMIATTHPQTDEQSAYTHNESDEHAPDEYAQNNL